MRRFSRCARPLLPSQGQVREAGKGRPESLHRSRGLPGASGFTREGFQGQAGRAESCGEIAYAARFSLRCVMSKSSGCVSPVVGQFENERIPLLAEEGNVATLKKTAKIQTDPPSAHQITFTANWIWRDVVCVVVISPAPETGLPV